MKLLIDAVKHTIVSMRSSFLGTSAAFGSVTGRSPAMLLAVGVAVGVIVLVVFSFVMVFVRGGGEDPAAASGASPAEVPEETRESEPKGPPTVGESAGGEDEVRRATEEFIMAAYGYTGDDPNEYLEGVEEHITDDFWDQSLDGVDRVRDNAALLEGGQGPESGTPWTVVNEVEQIKVYDHEFEHLGRMWVEAFYTAIDSQDGEQSYWTRKIYLVPQDGDWKVRDPHAPRELSGG